MAVENGEAFRDQDVRAPPRSLCSVSELAEELFGDDDPLAKSSASRTPLSKWSEC